MALSVMPRVERLHLPDVLLPQGHPAAPAGGVAVVFGFVIDHPDGAILVDTGVGKGNEFIDQAYAPTVRDLEATLLGVGIEPTSVVAVVNSHLHFDHCGQNPTYYGSTVPVFVQAEEVAASRQPYYTDPDWAAVPLPSSGPSTAMNRSPTGSGSSPHPDIPGATSQSSSKPMTAASSSPPRRCGT